MRIKEHGVSVPLDNYPGNYLNTPMPDANQGRGYGKLSGDAKNRPISVGTFPYDIYEPDEGPEPFDADPLLQNKFSDKIGTYAQSRQNYSSKPLDPFAYFDDATVGLSENLIRSYVKLYLEDIFRLSGRSSETDGAVTQWGTRMPGGTQFGWSSAFPFPQKKDQYEPVFSLKDLMTKQEDKTDRTHGELEPEPNEEWKEEYGKEQHDQLFPLFW